MATITKASCYLMAFQAGRWLSMFTLVLVRKSVVLTGENRVS